ncbi:MAG: 1-acyl-sn-glycerol-3-phosphate acyltransferase [Burkholderiaceae bacterium]|jgi:1-acyl-sn-glycerol-3-phosphate acyltransferase|nr:1-acyl-sn-glycerol-3-phosphate acyltransferase [Burkholderiaceae bacterium]
MNVLRTLIFFLMLAIGTVIWGTLCLSLFFLPFRLRFRLARCWNKFVVWLAKVVCGIRYQTKGMDALPDAPLILLSKHQSAWETFFFFCWALRPPTFVLKRELLRIPFFGWVLALLRMIPIDRANNTQAFRRVIAHGKHRLANGHWIFVFPEGTRTQPGTAGKYSRSGARLAIETHTPVIPVALNSGMCWPKDSLIKKPGLITVSFGAPILPDGKTPDDLMQEVEDWIEAEIRRFPFASSVTEKVS